MCLVFTRKPAESDHRPVWVFVVVSVSPFLCVFFPKETKLCSNRFTVFTLVCYIKTM